MTRILLFCFLAAITTQLSLAQAPGTDCGTATALTLVPAGTISTGIQTVPATPAAPGSYGTGISACVPGSAFYGDAPDGAYSINVTTAGDYTFAYANSGTSTWKSLSVHSGCAPTAGNCVGGFVTGTNRDGSTTITLTPGTYYIIVDSWATLTPLADFELLITSPISNDECTGAIGLTVNPDLNCGTTTFGTTVGATASPQADDVIGTPDNDVWYSFVATNTSHRVSALNETLVTGSADISIGVYDGSGGCGALILEGSADDPETLDLTGLIIGNTYYVRVYGYWADPTDEANFEVCVGTPPPPPSNDEPCNAVALTVNPDLNCGVVTAGTVESATNSGIDSCGFSNPDDDVWYSFVATDTNHRISLTNIVGSDLDMYIAVYGPFIPPNCAVNTGNNIACSDPNTTDVTGLIIGRTYYVQIFTYFSGSENTTFDICVGTPAPPSNDDCANAILLTSDQSCIITNGTSEFATLSQSGCTGNADDDVWYSFVATGSEHTITVDPVTMSNAVFQVFEGSCGGPSLSCVNNTSGGLNEAITFNSLTPGTSYYIRVYSQAGAPSAGTFNICITEPCVSTVTLAPPSCTLIADDTNNDPFAAVPFVADPQIQLECDTGQVTLEAHSNFHETTSYRVERIPYSVSSGLGGGLNNQNITSDDVWAPSSTNIGFDFCFYGQTYTHFLVGANGKVTFDINDPGNGLAGSNTPGSFSGWQFDENLPSTDGSLVDYAIYGVYHDIDPRGLPASAIQTELVGTGNCRKMVISWNDIPMFGDATRLYSGRIELYESTNIIEVHIEEKLIENGNVNPWNDGNAIVGIQGNSSAGEALTAPCRGIDPNWEVPNTPTTREAWRFVPDGAPRVPSSVTWYTGSLGGTVVGTNNTLTVNTANTYYVEATFPTCSGSITVDDDIVVTDPRKIWDGSVDNNWYVANNWTPAGVPDLDDCVVIPDQATTPNDPVADQLNAAPLPPTTPGMARNLTLQANAYLEVETNTELLVREWVNVNASGTLNIKSSGSLIQMEDTAVNTGNIHVQRSPNFDESPVGADDYVYWSSPVASFAVGNISPSSSQIYSWIPTVPGNGTGNHGEWSASGGPMDDATGYIIRSLGGTPANIPATAYPVAPNTALFSGVPNNGVFTKQIFHGGYNGAPYAGNGNTATNEDDNWNLIGNPYPSAISANAFVDYNTNINGTVYVWPHSSAYSAITADPFYESYYYNYDGNDYLEHNNLGSNPPGTNDMFIGSGQGFFVLMNHSAPTGSNVTFNNSMRYDDTIDDLIINYDNSNFYRLGAPDTNGNEDASGIERHRIWLDLLSPNQVTNSILVGYATNATNGFDRLFDGYDFSGDNSGFYSLLEGEGLSIQGRALPFLQEDTIPLGMVANATGEHTIAINTVDGLFLEPNQGIYLEDTLLNVIHDLREAPYSVTVSQGVHDDRFILRYTDESLGVDSFETDSLTIMAPNGEYIKVISGVGEIDAIEVFDIVGKAVYSKNGIGETEFIINDNRLSNGVYIVKARLANGKRKLQKLVLRK